MPKQSSLPWHELALAGFLFSDFYKAATLDIVQFDVTLGSGLLCAFAALHRAHQYGWRIPLKLGWVALIFVLALIPALYTTWNGYGITKMALFYSVTMLAAFTAPVILRDVVSVERFAYAVIGVGLVMTCASFVSQRETFYDLQTLDVGTISLGRGYAATILALLFVAGARASRFRRMALLATVPVLAALIASGNRQSVVALVLAVGVTAVTASGTTRRQTVTWLSGLAITVFAAWNYILPKLPTFALHRYNSLLSGGDNSASKRLEMWRAVWDGAPVVGHGWGAFANLDIAAHRGATHNYPHNVYLEAWYELGVVVAALLLALVVFGAVRMVRVMRHRMEEEQSVYRRLHPKWVGSASFALAFLVFFAVVAAVSGDLYSNKALFAAVGTALCLRVNPGPYRSHAVFGPHMLVAAKRRKTAWGIA